MNTLRILEAQEKNPVAETITTRDELIKDTEGNKAVIQKDLKLPENIVSEADKEELAQTAEENEAQQKEKKSIYDEIEAQEEAVAESVATDRWSVGPSIAPVYFSSLGEGSPIHSNFASNSKSGNLNLSYGLSVGYELSKKLSIRSGIHKVDYGYDTNDVSFTSSLTASTATQLANIDYANTSKNLVVESSAAPGSTGDLALNSEEIRAQDPSRQGRMVQQFGYVEVPLELNYSLMDKKFGVNLIGGLSSLFLVNNSVSLESEGRTTEIGEANNINSVNFSTNIGLGINYKVSQKVLLNLEPMFKYQLNTFSDASGNFQPFSVGVYSGLKYKF